MSVPDHVHESIDAIVGLHEASQRNAGRHQQRIERLTSRLGRPRTLYIVGGFILGWMGANGFAVLVGHHAFDQPPFQILQTIMSAAALLLTTMVLIVETRQSHTDDRRSNFDLQINLLAEKKAAKIIELLETLRRDMPSVPNRHDQQAKEMSTALDPKVVAEALDRSIDHMGDQSDDADDDGAETPKRGA